MNMLKAARSFNKSWLTWLILAFWAVCSGVAMGAVDEKFDVLEIGTHTYHNVTITTKTKKYIFLMHSAGMSNIKVSDLSPELRDKLGYTAMEAAENAQAHTNALSAWAKQTLHKMEIPQLKELEATIVQGGKIDFRSGPVVTALAVAVSVYLLFCYCGMLICRKTGNEAGVLIWIPLLQIFPLLRAASMAPGWFFAFLIPIVNVVALIAWAINIAQARGKSGWVAFCLLLPLTNVLAYAYLAFSGIPKKKEKPAPRVELMTLETA